MGGRALREPSGTDPDAAATFTAERPPEGSRSRRIGPIALLLALLATTGLVVGGLVLFDRLAERRAAVAAATDEAREGLAVLAEALASSAGNGHRVSAELHQTLQEHLTVSERTDEQLATDRTNQQAAAAEAGQQLQDLGSAPPPDLPPLADRDALAGQLDRLADARGRAGELGVELTALAAASDRWAQALLSLRAQHANYVTTVEAQPDATDPAQLKALWEEERAILGEYRAVAEATAQVPGLEDLASVYLDYVDDNLAFADQAVELLARGDVDAYNARLREVFDVEDPFGFRAEVEEATRVALDGGVLTELQQLVAGLVELESETAGLEEELVGA